jgi:hypothetical protein
MNVYNNSIESNLVSDSLVEAPPAIALVSIDHQIIIKSMHQKLNVRKRGQLVAVLNH